VYSDLRERIYGAEGDKSYKEGLADVFTKYWNW